MVKVIDLTIFSDIKESDILRVCSREFEITGKVDISIKLREDQQEMLIKLQLPRWKDGRTRDGKLWKSIVKNTSIGCVSFYESPFGAVSITI